MISNAITAFRIGLVLPLFLWLANAGTGWFPLLLFLLIGLLDMVDGRVARRLGESSVLGGVLDLIGDRLLTLAAVGGLLLADVLPWWGASAAMVLVARCTIFASFGEALGPARSLPPSDLEHPKIAASFLGLSLAIGPAFGFLNQGWGQPIIASGVLMVAAGLTAKTLVEYCREGVRRLANQEKGPSS